MANLEERGIKYVLDATDYVEGANQVSASSEKIEKSSLEAAQGLLGIDKAMRAFKQSAAATTPGGYGALLDQFPLLNQQIREAISLQKEWDAEVGKSLNKEESAREKARSRELSSLKSSIQERAAAQSKWDSELGSSLNKEEAARERARATELSGLRRSITERAAAQSRWDAEVGKSLNKEESAREKARSRELAALRRDIQERAAIRDKANAAQVAYANAAKKAGVAYGEQIPQNLAATRYALYDVASTYRQVSVASLAAMTAVTATGMAFETAFTGVERTADLPVQKMQELRDELVNLSTEIPESFSNLSSIATLGGQLGIAGENLDGFAENVAMFSATTNASIEATAEGFGRLAQLTDAGTESFASIGSAIYTVGVNSVATETEIMNVAQEIATAGNLAGFSTADIIGLSGALASLGVQPERARGNIQRIFAEIGSAVSEGGAALDNFAKLSGKTSDEFVKAWKTAPSETFVSLIDGLGNAASSGQDLDSVLNALGIKAVRDVQTMKQLADNTDLLHQTMTDANTAYGEATSLQDAYGSTADNLASKLTELLNSVKGILDELSQNAALGWVVDQIKLVTNGVLQLLQALGPVGDGIGAIITIGTLAVGVFAATNAAVLTLRAGYLAMMTAQTNLAASGATLDLSLKNMVRSLGQMAFTSQSAVTGLNNVTAAATRAATATSSVGAAQGAASAAGNAGSMVAGWAKGGIIMAGLSAAVWGAAKAWEAYSNATASATDKATKFYGSIEGLQAAVKQDTETAVAGGGFIGSFTSSVQQATTVTPQWQASLEAASGAQVRLAGSTQQATQAVSDQILYTGQASAQWLANQLANSTQFQEIWKNNSGALDAAGFSFQEWTRAILSNTGTEYLNSMIEKTNNSLDVLSQSTQGSTADIMDQQNVLYDAINVMNSLKDISDDTGGTFQEMADKTAITNDVMAAFGYTTSDTGDAAETAATQIQTLSDTLFGGANASASFEGAMYDLGNSLYTNGADFSAYSEAGRANLSALATVVNAAANAAGNDANALATYLTAIINSLSGYGVNVAALFPQLVAKAGAGNVDKLNAAMSQQSVTAGYAAAQNKAYGSAAKRAGSGAAAAAKEVRTLSDYVSDLSSVMKSAFDIRWGGQKAADDVADAFQKLVDMKQDAQDAVTDAFSGLEDARQNVTDLRRDLAGLNADLQGLKADKHTLTYQLGVARDYGDTLRENEILAALAKNQEDVADKQNDIAKTSNKLTEAQGDVKSATAKVASAQEYAKRTLTANTESSREQRSAVLDLVQSYQDQITALANSGLSQQQLAVETEKLRAKFYAQMQQLGYSRVEADKYAKSFDDMRKIIERLPRNITMAVNMDPALRALQEFEAKAKKSGAAAGRNLADGFAGATGGLQGPTLQVKYKLPSYAELMAMQAAIRAQTGDATFRIALGPGGQGGQVFASGGFTGRGGKYDPAGIVHKGEFVVPKSMVNQSTGLPYANALGAITQGFANGGYVRSAPSVRFPTTQIVELSPTDRALLAAAGNVTVTMDGRVVAMATNANNINQSRRG